MIDPRGLSLQDWADSTVPLLEKYGIVPILDGPLFWRPWARVVCDLPAIRSRNPPDPDNYDDWLPWAERMNGLGL
jgi:hypothetical protein